MSEYYFSNGKLIFYYSEYSRYKVPLGVADKESGKIKSIEKERYYFDKGVLIKHINTPIKKFSLNLATDAQQEAKRLLTFMQKRKN